jgi:hypothetical protein
MFDASQLFDPRFTQLDGTKLAQRLGVSTWVVKGMRIAAAKTGDSPFMGRYTTADRALRWLENHPDFVASHHLRKTKSPQQPGRGLMPPAADKSGGWSPKRGRRKPSPEKLGPPPGPSS